MPVSGPARKCCLFCCGFPSLKRSLLELILSSKLLGVPRRFTYVPGRYPPDVLQGVLQAAPRTDQRNPAMTKCPNPTGDGLPYIAGGRDQNVTHETSLGPYQGTGLAAANRKPADEHICFCPFNYDI